VIPDALPEDNWAGMGTVYLPKCNCDRFAKLKKACGAGTLEGVFLVAQIR